MRWLTAFALLSMTSIPVLAQDDASDAKKEKKNAVPSLQEEIDAKKAEYTKEAPKEALEAFAKGIEDVRNTGIEKNAVNVNAKAPTFTLKDANGKEVALETLLKDGPVVVTFFRGSWCVFCNMQLRAYQGILKKLEKQGAKIVALTPQTAEHSKKAIEDLGVSFPLLSDPESKVAMEYGLAYKLPESVVAFQEKTLKEYNDSDEMVLPLAATYVIDQDGMIRYAFVDADYSKRAEPTELLKAVRKISDKKGKKDKADSTEQ
jgi:peroxiredoxin